MAQSLAKILARNLVISPAIESLGVAATLYQGELHLSQAIANTVKAMQIQVVHLFLISVISLISS
ncbi:hypothetical protein H6F67_07315 [Microcoleus sp. FACHB-1515]|uniref:hypothetical protein n=1 Tax=Cyanophyceae TaxID=3028117 RepID=UPI001687D632|nr:hypothetical protein [Microcoleus sp. FACHB-1515]MBD2089661.1 hypothetical protein [Microcoleus sp. FACHB-1515]